MKKLFLIVFTFCLGLLALGTSACFGSGNNEPDDVPVTEIVLDKSSLELDIGGTYTLQATVLPDNATEKTVLWKTSNADVATVVKGKVTAVSSGNAVITAVSGEKSATCSVTVKEEEIKTIPVESVTISEASAQLTAGETLTLTATVLPANATDKTLSWSSSNEAVATVVNGVVTAKTVGDATITVTAGGISATCEVAVKAKIIAVTSITLNKAALELKEGETFTLTATVTPNNATDKEVIWSSSDKSVATVEDGVVTAISEGTANIIAKIGTVEAVCEIAVIKDEVVEPVIPDDSIITYAHAGEESAAFEWKDTNASGAKVEYKLSTSQSYTAIDKQLIRQISADTARADILGLKGGFKYDFKITSSDKKVSYAKEVIISSLDRSGYAHHNYTSGVGAYNDDGTLKDNAVVIYVTEENKNDVDGKGNSIAEYLSNMKNVKTPVVVRIVGTVGSATWNEIKYDKGTADKLPANKVVGKDGKTQLPTSSSGLTQDALIKGVDDKPYNTLNLYPAAYNGKKCDPIDGLVSKASYSSGEYDSCWNDCQVQNATNLTIEGVGEDAEIFQWGFTFKNCNSIEVRNLRFYDYTEDACSVEASNGNSNANDPDAFKSKNFWIHHNVFDIGVNYWDVCAEQDKGDGDGSTDFKYISYVTVAYNRYNGTHKTGLVGGGDSVNSACFTFHHNYYNQCDQRMPLGRQANMHIYNNYFYKSGLYSISLRASAYAFIENCVFTSKNTTGTATKPVELVKGSNGVPSAKIIDCEMEGTIANGISDVNNLYVGSDRTKTVEGDNRYGLNFELDDGFYTVTNKLDTNKVAKEIPTLAGTQKRNSNIKIEGGTEVEPPVVDPDPPIVDPTDGQSLSYTSAGATVAVDGKISDGALFTAVWNLKSATVTQGKSAAVADGKSFGYALLSDGTGGGVTVTAKKAITLTIYYGASDSKFATTDQEKGGNLVWTIDGGNAVTSAKTENKSNRVAYSETITLEAGQEIVFTISSNRFVLYGLYAQ